MDTQKSNVIDFFTKVPKAYQELFCLFCHTEHNKVVPRTHITIYHTCPGCDETASIPWTNFRLTARCP